MQVLGIIGKSGSGKTTLIAKLIAELHSRRFTVSTIKHAKAGVSLDQPGKDSYVHRDAGAGEVALITRQRWALLRELQGMPEPSIGEVIAAMTPVDIDLVEGLHRLRVHRSPALRQRR